MIAVSSGSNSAALWVIDYMDLGVLGLFVLFGFLAKKGYKWAFIVGYEGFTRFNRFRACKNASLVLYYAQVFAPFQLTIGGSGEETVAG